MRRRPGRGSPESCVRSRRAGPMAVDGLRGPHSPSPGPSGGLPGPSPSRAALTHDSGLGSGRRHRRPADGPIRSSGSVLAGRGAASCARLPSPRTELPCHVAAASPDARLTTRPDARFRPSRRLGARNDLAPARSSAPESSAKGPIRSSGTLLPRIVPGVIHDFAVAAARHPSPPGRAPHRPSWPFCGLCGPVPSQLWKSLWMPVDDVLRPQGTHCEELQGSCGRSTARPRAVPAIPRFRPQESHIRIPVISSADDRIPQNPRALIRLRAPL